MSFSIVAVLLLILSGISVTVFVSSTDRDAARQQPVQQLGEMEDAATQEALGLEEAAYALAIQAAQVGPGNESVMDQRFQLQLLQYRSDRYPLDRGGLEISLNRSSIGLLFLRLNAVEAASVTAQIVGEEALKGVTIPAYLTLAGSFTLRISSASGFMLKQFEISRHVYVPTPLLLNRMDAFAQAFQGGRCEFENVVRYEVSALAQSRVLQGYGMTSMYGVTGTEAVITEADVENAAGLAIVLEQLRSLRTVDQEMLGAILERFPGSGEAKADALALLSSGGSVDPADLFLRLSGSGGYDLRLLLAQTVYAAADVLALRWLDYLHVLDVARFLEDAGEAVQLTLTGVLDALLGGDAVNRSAIEWVEKRLRDAGVSEEEYRYLDRASPDAYITVPSYSWTVVTDAGEPVELCLDGTYAIDFPTRDVLASSEWKRFLLEYKSGTYELAETLKAFVQTIALGIASAVDLPTLTLTLDPLDESDFITELEEQAKSALASSGDWFTRAAREATDSFKIKDRMGEALSRFVSENWALITDEGPAVADALDHLARQTIEDAAVMMPGWDESSMESAVESVKWQMELGSLSGVVECVRAAFESGATGWLKMMQQVFGNLTLDGLPFDLDKLLVGLVAGAVEGIPGIKAVVERMMLRSLADMHQASSIRADRLSVTIPGQRYFALQADNQASVKEALEVDCLLPWLSGRSDGITVEIMQPWDYPRSVEDCPNRHVTDLANMTLSPFATQWGVTVRGGFDLTVCTESDDIQSRPLTVAASVASHVNFGFELTVSTHGGWPVSGVDYSPTMTLLKQVAEVFDLIWQAIVGVLQWIGDAIGKLFSFVQDVLSTVLSYATKIVEWLSNVVLSLIEGVRDLIEGALSGVIGWLADSISNLIGGNVLKMNIFGLGLTFKGGTSDLAFGYGEMVRISLFWPILDGSFSITSRFLRLRNVGYDVVVNGSLSGSGWSISGQLDPLMRMMDHCLEIKACLNGYMVEIAAPEVTQYEKVSFALSDMPAIGSFLSNIPSPIPGFKAAIDAGFEAKFNRPFDRHVVINEVELNPPGADEREEWVELFNPMLHPEDLSGWTFETAHGRQTLTDLGHAEIASGGHTVYHFDGQVLDNGGESGLPVGESVILRNAEGKKIDSTPFITDYYNDGRTWQRSVDASEHWEFKEETMGSRNGVTFYRGSAAQEFYRIIADAVSKALARSGSIDGLGGLAKLITVAIEDALDYLVETLGDVVVEINFFVELKLQDYSGSMSGDFRLSLVVTGKCIKDGLRWIADAVLTALGNVLNPAGAAPRGHSVNELLDDIYIRFGAFLSVGLPKLVSPVRQGETFRFGAVVDMNLAAILAPNAGHNWSVGFGALFEGIPADRLSGYYGIDADRLADFWIVRATLGPASSAPA
jgi:hypothetical protein